MILINPDIMEQVKQIGIPIDEIESIVKSVLSIKFEARK